MASCRLRPGRDAPVPTPIPRCSVRSPDGRKAPAGLVVGLPMSVRGQVNPCRVSCTHGNSTRRWSRSRAHRGTDHICGRGGGAGRGYRRRCSGDTGPVVLTDTSWP